MKEGCWDCVIKHLSDAKATHIEVLMGYPDHAMDVIGGLSQASEEIYEFSPAMAEVFREHRKAFTEDMGHMPPYYALYAFVRLMQVSNEAQIEMPEIPESLKVNEDGISIEGTEEDVGTEPDSTE